MMDEETKHLLSFLEEAAEEMISYGEKPTFSYFDKCKDVGIFIQDITNKMKKNVFDDVSELWYIFAPTGDIKTRDTTSGLDPGNKAEKSRIISDGV